jgi:molybdate transport system ATP-binding protein
VSYELRFDLRTHLERFTLEVAHVTRSRSLGLFGPSGSGKTTVVEALAGWRAVDHGHVALDAQVWLDTRSRTNLGAARRRVGYVPQDQLLFPHLDVEANLRFGCGRDQGLVQRVLDVLEIEALRARDVATLSGGERQRVALGRALCSRPRLLLLDEPFGALDKPLRRRILPYLLRVRDEFDTPFVLVSHDATEVSVACDEVLVLSAGRVVARGAPAEVLAPAAAAEEQESFENVLRGRVASVGATTALVDLGGALLETPRGSLEPREQAVVSVRADEVIVAAARPVGLSARNVLAARVERVVPGAAARILARCGAQPVWVDLTDAAIADLGLAEGRAVFLVVKTRSCRVLSKRAKP